VPYQRFDLTAAKETVAKIVWRIGKVEQNNVRLGDFGAVRKLHRETNDQMVEELLGSQWEALDELLTSTSSSLHTPHTSPD
jgi:hypothetical protein